MVVINTEECIDCAVCEPECLVDVIKRDSILDAAKWIALNQKYVELCPNFSEKGEPTADADGWADVPDKMVHLSKNLA